MRPGISKSLMGKEAGRLQTGPGHLPPTSDHMGSSNWLYHPPLLGLHPVIPPKEQVTRYPVTAELNT
jgi:hypothetical protein